VTGRIIRLHGGPHDEIRALLPWYVTGRLEAGDHARVAAHLKTCRACQEDVEFERRLEVEVAAAPMDVEQGWMAMRRRLAQTPARRRLSDRLGGLWQTPTWLGWALASQALLIVAAGALTLRDKSPAPPAAVYRALGAPTRPTAGNALLMFRPDTPERVLRRILQVADARLIDGPTAAGAYVVKVPSAERSRVLARLRARPEVTLAQPLDPAGPS
jgi:hypothetical protein